MISGKVFRALASVVEDARSAIHASRIAGRYEEKLLEKFLYYILFPEHTIKSRQWFRSSRDLIHTSKHSAFALEIKFKIIY